MKKIIHGLLGAVLAVSSVSAAVSNKTYMADRGTLSNNIVMGHSAQACDYKGGIGANVSVAGFYRLSHNDKDLAQYFGMGLTDATRLGTTTVAEDAMIYQSTDTGSVAYKPQRQEYGAHINWTQCLSKFVKGMSLSVDVPVVHVQTDMRAAYTQTAGTQMATFFEGGAVVANDATVKPMLESLAYQKHNSKANAETGVADIAASLGYKFAGDADYSLAGSIDVVIPTGKKPAGVWAFEPVYGGKHFYLGAGLNGAFNLWRSEDKKSELGFNAALNYKYGFAAKEVRTMGLYDADAKAVIDGGHYRSTGDGTTAAGTSLTAKPVANMTTLECDVTPESSIDAVAGFNYKFNRFNVGVHYNMNYNQEETVKVRAGQYTNTTYGIAGAYTDDSDGSESIAISGGVIGAQTATSGNRIDPAAATTPSKVTHKVGGGADYSFATKTPITVGIGGEGEFNSNNDSINSWAVWAKVGFCF